MQQSEDYRRIEKAIKFIESHFKSQPTLEKIAESVHLSKYHFDRLFKRWAGISPIQFMQFLTLDYAKKRLSESKNLLETALDAGLSGPSRLHDLFVTFEAMTPGDFKKQGVGLTFHMASANRLSASACWRPPDGGYVILDFWIQVNGPKHLASFITHGQVRSLPKNLRLSVRS